MLLSRRLPFRPGAAGRLSGDLSPRFFLFVLLLFVASTNLFRVKDSYQDDLRAFYVAGEDVWARLDPYRNQVNVSERYADRTYVGVESRFIYPPTALFFLAPLARLPYPEAKVLFTGSMLALLAATLLALDRRFPVPVPMLFLLLCSVPVVANVEYGQIDILILALVVEAYLLGDRAAAGLCLAAAAAIKVFPLLMLGWLLVARRWRAAAAAVAGSAALAAAAALVWGPGYFREFAQHLSTHQPGHAYTATLQHNFTTVQDVGGRLLLSREGQFHLRESIPDEPENPLAGPLKSGTAYAGLALLLAALLWLRLTRAGRAVPEAVACFGFLTLILFSNRLLWPMGLVLCFPLAMVLTSRSRAPMAVSLLLGGVLAVPLSTLEPYRFLLAGACALAVFWMEQRRQARGPGTLPEPLRG